MNDLTQEIEAIILKIDRQMTLYGTQFPHVSLTGKYSEQLIPDGSWTGSFWTGMVYLAYRYTGSSKYLDYLLDYLPVYERRLREGYLDHDTGFLYQLYAAVLYQATGNQEAAALLVQAADALAARYNAKGKFIRAWGELHDPERSGKIIIDCMMNLPLLYSASALTGNPDYLAMADHHARTALEHQIRPNYSTYHTFDFDPETGRPIGGFNEGGYSDDSTWARGQAWGIYGFALAYRHTGKQEYAEAAQGLAEYFLKYLPDDNVPYWDYALPDFNRALKDTSAAAIAACGIIEMHHLAGGRGPWASYRLRAEQMLGTLQAGYSAAEDPLCEGLLKCAFARIDGVEWELYSIWGDYFYMEGLLMLSGYRPDAWSLEVGKP